jgi:muconate cycloisomerase
MPRRFVRLEIHEVRIPFRFSFRHALAERRENRALLLALRTEEGATGVGEVLPREYLSGETVEGARAAIRERWWPRLRRVALPDAPGEEGAHAVLDALAELYAEADAARETAAWAGLDVAAVDAWARAVGLGGRRLFGDVPTRRRLTAPLGSGGVRATRRSALAFRLLGFRDYKLKMTGADDALRVRAARRAVGRAADLRVDANGAWSAEAARAVLPELAATGVSSVEQPVPAGDPAALVELERGGGLPVMADESLVTRADAEALLAAGGVALWNLRLGKNGGFSGVRALARLAEAAGAACHLGVLVGETGCLQAAARGALGLAEWRHVEYGFSRILLADDPVRGGPAGYTGRARPLGGRPGLGIRLDERVLRRLAHGSEVLE